MQFSVVKTAPMVQTKIRIKMPKIILQREVKYNGNKIPSNTPFECDIKDLKEFQAKGCHVFIEEIKEPKIKK